MSSDVFVFHSSEVDDQSLVAARGRGWYVGSAVDDTLLFTDACAGPYATQSAATLAMRSGAWINPALDCLAG
jgi:hypothetical protein